MKTPKWKKFLILAAAALALYNVFPTLLYYAKPLERPLTESEARSTANEITQRIKAAEEESIHWISSFCTQLQIKPQTLRIVPEAPQWIELSFTRTEEANRFRSYLPRAGSLIPFAPQRLALSYVQPEDGKTVLVQRRIAACPEENLFSYAPQGSEPYRDWISNRFDALNHSIASGDAHFSHVEIDWDQQMLVLTPRSKNPSTQTLMDELARIGQETEELFSPLSDNRFAAAFHQNPQAAGVLLLSLQPLAEQELSHLRATIELLWHPKHPDLLSQQFPIVDDAIYAALSPEEQSFCLHLSRDHALVVQAHGLKRIIDSHSESSQLQNDLNALIVLLHQQGFSISPTSADPVFERAHFYRPLLEASREQFITPGSGDYAVVEYSTLEQRIWTQNQIEAQIHTDLLKQWDDYSAATVALTPDLRFDAPKPSVSPFWSNFWLNVRKYFRGDERKILRWGLDLSGGKSVEVELLDADQRPISDDADLHRGINELHQRLNKLGLAEVSIRQIGRHIAIDIPGSPSLSAAELIQPSSMHFHVVNETFSLYNPRLSGDVNRFLQEVWNEASVSHRTDAASIQEISWRHWQTQSSEAARNLAREGLIIAPPEDRSSSATADQTLSQVAKFRGNEPSEWMGQSHPLLIVFHNHALEGANLQNIHASYDPTKGNYLSFEVAQQSARPGEADPRDTFWEWTSRFSKEKISGTPLEAPSQGRGWRMAVLLNGSIISSPSLDSALRESAMISGSFSQREVLQLANDLKAGSMTFTPHILSEKNISPELGKSDRMRGIFGVAAAFAAVLGAMAAYYRFAGLISCAAVLFNLVIIWAILQNLGAALSLAGLAGIILTVALAVDANVLVFERIREEVAKGQGIGAAIAAGYRKAYSAIIDSNATTLIASLILFQFEAGPVKSFSINLMIGIASSMFTALFVTHFYFERWAQNPKTQALSMANWIPVPRFDFLKRAKTACFVALALIAVGTTIAFEQRNSLFGMDFTGGFALNFNTQKIASPHEIEQALIKAGASTSDLHVRELSSAHDFRLLLGTSMEQPGKPFAALSSEAAPRIEWITQALTAANIPLATQSLESQWASMSGQMSETMRNQALAGFAVALLCIFAYISMRFDSSFAFSALLCVAHDILVTLGFIALLHALGAPLQIDLNSIAALMTIVGYSLNDTIIIFDRIREERRRSPGQSLASIINHAISVTLSRTAITSGAMLLVLLTLAIVGGTSLLSFACTMIIGVVFGTLSSWFIAAPLALIFEKRRARVYS